MGLTNSLDVFQSVIHPLFQDIPEVECFIDDIGVFTNSTFEQHLIVLHQVLFRLKGNGFTVNPTKRAWVAQSSDYLGFLLTTDGIKPLPQKLRQLVASLDLRPLHTYVRS